MAERKLFPTLIGNEKMKKILSSDIALGKGAHAYVLDGPTGSGKHTAARIICAASVCEHRTDDGYAIPCGECPSCRKILSGISVDVLTLSNNDKATIGVDSIRAIKETLYVTPNDGDRKFYIIENAHLMTPSAQNALLLSLEEPPPYVMFLLLCEDATRLLETIKSRAPVIKMELFSPEFTEEYLAKKHPKAAHDKLVYAAHLSDGALGYADALLEHGESEMKLYRLAEKLAEAMLSTKKTDGMLFIPSLPKERASVCRILSLTRIALRDAVAAKKGGVLLFYSKSDGVPAFTKKISVRRLIELTHLLSQAENDIASNCSVNTVMTSLILNSQKG